MSIATETEPLLETEPRDTVSVAVPVGLRLKVSPEDFWTLCQCNRDLRLERTARGELIAISPSGFETGWLELEIGGELRDWAKGDRTGRVIGSSGGFTLPNGTIRAADVAWILEKRWNALTKKQRSKFAPIVPDFVIKICSPSDSRQETRAKMAEYIEQGVRLGWLIDARTSAYEVEIHRPGQAPEILKQPETVSGEDVLPGFILELGKIIANAD